MFKHAMILTYTCMTLGMKFDKILMLKYTHEFNHK